MFDSCESCERAWQKGFYIVVMTQSNNGEVYIPPQQQVVIVKIIIAEFIYAEIS
jgi:hypothetical protein